ncbi:MAG: GntP family permease [Bacteroidales bacterium]|nr:GntP family permease [Bacteroidales bacterium]
MTAIGALLGLILSIVMIIRKINPTYSMILGAIAGGLIGGISLTETVTLMIGGIKDITPAIIRILTAGVLTGVLIKTGAAESIAETIVRKLGKTRVLFALVLSTFLLTAIGVFIDVAVITVAPIALAVAEKSRLTKMTVLLEMIGGGKCGNIISPNPNTLIAAENFQVNLFSVMMVNLIPALLGIFVVLLIIKWLPGNGELVSKNDFSVSQHQLPSFFQSISGPVVTVLLLGLRPIAGISIDPLLALPIGGIAGILIIGKTNMLKESVSFGLEKMSVVAILLIGTGTIAGIIKNSDLKDYILNGLAALNMSEFTIAPVAGALMSAATASTTAGATIASASFANIIISAGINGIFGAAMVNAGATVFDHLPHGSFFHATAGASAVQIKERLKLIPFESLIGFSLAFISTLYCWISAMYF